jgi:hypothetical protein
MPAYSKEADQAPTLRDGLEEIQTTDGFRPVYRWRTGVWYISVAGRVQQVLSGADIGIAHSDNLMRHFPRRRDHWRHEYTHTPGLPLHVFRVRDMWAAVVPGEHGRIRAETLAPTEDLAVSRTIDKANHLRRRCREARDRAEARYDV